jgi:hypothetical protein
MIPPKMKNRAVWGFGDKNATGYEVVPDNGDDKIFADSRRCPEDQGWKRAPIEYIGMSDGDDSLNKSYD